jgi:hypothetical protein
LKAFSSSNTDESQTTKFHFLSPSCTLGVKALLAATQLGRRNLTPSQKAALALEIEKQLAAEAKKRQLLSNTSKAILPDSYKGQARDKAAEMVSASPRYVQDVKQAERDAPEFLEHAKQGKLSIPQAKKVAALPATERAAVIERIRNKKPEEVGYIYRDGQCVEVQTNVRA